MSMSDRTSGLGALFRPAAALLNQWRLPAKTAWLLLGSALPTATWIGMGALEAAPAWRLAATVAMWLVVAWLLVACMRSFAVGFADLRRQMLAISMGDLRASMQVSRPDELGDLQRELAAMQKALRQTVHQVQQAGDSVVQASLQIAEGTRDLSARTESAAAALEQSSAALEQTTASVCMMHQVSEW